MAKIMILLFVSFTILGLSISTLFSSNVIVADNTPIETRQAWGAVPKSNLTNIVLVHGIWGDGSVWSKVIPILLVPLLTVHLGK